MQTVEERAARHFAFSIWHYAAAISLVFLVAHLALLPASLEDLDSINFALGLRHFDVAQHQPHPPGYPVYIAAGRVVSVVVGDAAKALGTISAVAGALAVFAVLALFARLDPRLDRRFAAAGALLVVTCPLFWVTSSRPLSDVFGLTAAVAIQALTLGASVEAGLVTASVLAVLAIGIRSQVAWLTLPLLALVIARWDPARRARLGKLAIGAFLAGVAVWAIPLVVLTGGPSAYWRALFSQGAADL